MISFTADLYKPHKLIWFKQSRSICTKPVLSLIKERQGGSTQFSMTTDMSINGYCCIKDKLPPPFPKKKNIKRFGF